MKGFNLSKDYKILWKLINDGYRIPGWMPLPSDYPGKDENPIYDMVEIKMRDGRYMIGYRGQGYEQLEQTEESFVWVCGYWDIQFVLPNKTR